MPYGRRGWWEDEENFIYNLYQKTDTSKKTSRRSNKSRSSNKRDPDYRPRQRSSKRKYSRRANLRSDEIEAVLLGAAIANIPLIGTQLYIIINDDHPTLALVNNFQESKWQAIIAGMLIAYGSGKVWNFLLGGEKMTIDIDERTWKQRLLGAESKRTGASRTRVVPYKPLPGILGKFEREFKARSALGRVGAWIFGGFWAMAIISAGDYYLREYHDFSMDEAAADYLQRRANIHPLMNI